MIPEILQKIAEYQTIIIHRHIVPDGDAYGSSLGLKKWIQLNYPDKAVYAVGTDWPNLEFLGQMDVIADETYQNALVIVTDCGNVERIDDQRYSLGQELVKIDHHPNVTPYGDLVWVDPSYTSASEMVADLTYQAQKKLDKQTAQTIYFGIVTDSLRFLVQTTSERTFKMATYLMGTNFNLNELYQHMYHKNLNVLKAQGQLIETMQLQDHVGAIFLTPEIMQANQISYQQNGMFSNLLKDVDGIDIWVTFAKNADETWRVEFRSREVPINEVAIKWGGGGHKLASGAKIDSLDSAPLIITDLVQLLHQT